MPDTLSLEELAAIRDRADHHYVTHDDDGPTIHAGKRLDDVRALLRHIDALTAAASSQTRADWRHAMWCKYERGGAVDECNCGLTAFHRAMSAAEPHDA